VTLLLERAFDLGGLQHHRICPLLLRCLGSHQHPQLPREDVQHVIRTRSVLMVIIGVSISVASMSVRLIVDDHDTNFLLVCLPCLSGSTPISGKG